MLTAKACVTYDGDWTAELTEHDVFAEFLASTFRDRRYIGILALETGDMKGALDIIRSHPSIDTVDVIERYQTHSGRAAATIFLRGHLSELTPLETLLYEGYLPLGPTKLENGQECFDLLLNDREELSDAIDLLSDFGNVSIEHISDDFRREITPSRSEWQELLASVPPRRREILNKAAENGYFEIPRQVTLEEIAADMDITKSTASNHLRKAQHQLVEFLLPYMNLAADDR